MATSNAALSPATRAQSVTIIAAASLLMCLGMGMRQSFGLFMVPITGDLGLSVSGYTFALAMQNMIWGITQPFVGALADRFGMRIMLVLGALCFAAGLV